MSVAEYWIRLIEVDNDFYLAPEDSPLVRIERLDELPRMLKQAVPALSFSRAATATEPAPLRTRRVVDSMLDMVKLIADMQPVTSARLQRMMNRPSGTVRATISRLLKEGYIEAVDNRERHREYRLTPAAYKFAETMDGTKLSVAGH